MGKLVPLLFAGAGTATVSVGGFYLVKGSGSAVESTLTTTRTLLFDSVEKFKSESKNFDCVKKYFKNGDAAIDISQAETSAADFSSSSPTSGSFFKADASGSSTPYESCLVVNWRTETYGEKWKGIFTWIWTFVRGNEGFINFNIAQTSSTEQKLEFKGVFYLLGKEDRDGAQWEIKNKKEVNNSPKKAAEAQIDTYFPKVGTGVTVGDGKKDYWGFFTKDNKADKMTKICGSSDCQTTAIDPTVDVIELSWTGSKGSTKLKDWSANLDWWGNIYDNNSWVLKDKVGDFTGTWSQKTI